MSTSAATRNGDGSRSSFEYLERASPREGVVLSVVIVTYNEQARIRDCIESVIEACEPVVECEIILVDSNSTDHTVDRARGFPVTILQITDDEYTTPAAGRFIGTKAASGRFILFVDGDMVIESAWLERALSTINTDPTIAAVDGQLNTSSASSSVAKVDSVRGVALYRRSALESVGGFDPFLRSLEDIHLGFELTAAGYELLRLPDVAAEHPTRPALSEPFRRWRQGYSVGVGQAIRQSLDSRHLLRKHLSRIRYRLILIAWVCFGIGSLLVPPAILGWLGFSAIGAILLAITLGPRESVGFMLGKLFGIVGLGWGLLITPRPREAFPLDVVEVLQTRSDQETAIVRSR